MIQKNARLMIAEMRLQNADKTKAEDVVNQDNSLSMQHLNNDISSRFKTNATSKDIGKQQMTYMLDDLEDVNNDKSMKMQVSNLKKLGMDPKERKKKKKGDMNDRIQKSTNYYDIEGVQTSQEYP